MEQHKPNVNKVEAADTVFDEAASLALKLGEQVEKASSNSDQLVQEAGFLEIKKDHAQEDLKRVKDENKVRIWLVDATFTVTVLWLLFVLLIFIAYGQGKLHFPDGVMITFLTTTTANTLAFLTIIFKYLFHKPNP